MRTVLSDFCQRADLQICVLRGNPTLPSGVSIWDFCTGIPAGRDLLAVILAACLCLKPPDHSVQKYMKIYDYFWQCDSYLSLFPLLITLRICAGALAGTASAGACLPHRVALAGFGSRVAVPGRPFLPPWRHRGKSASSVDSSQYSGQLDSS